VFAAAAALARATHGLTCLPDSDAAKFVPGAGWECRIKNREARRPGTARDPPSGLTVSSIRVWIPGVGRFVAGILGSRMELCQAKDL